MATVKADEGVKVMVGPLLSTVPVMGVEPLCRVKLLPVTVAESTGSEKVAVMTALSAALGALSTGLTLLTCGAVVSCVLIVVNDQL